MKLPGSLGDLLATAQKVQQSMAGVQAELEKKRVVGAAGGGMVEVTIDGAMHFISVNMDASLFASADRDMVQDLVCAAANDAVRKAKDIIKEEFGKLTGGLPIPGLG